MRTDGLAHALISIAYVATGMLGMMLALPPGYASPIFLPAGISVAGVLIGGNKTLPWIFLGSLMLNVWIGYSSSQHFYLLGFAVATLIAIASLLQAAIGGWALRHVIGYPASFDQKEKFLRLLILAPFICLISASLSVSSLWMLDIVPDAGFFSNWVAWWFGDTLGVLVMLPLIMTVVDAPSSARNSRLRTVTVPILLVLSTGFVVVYFLQQSAFNSARQIQRDSFEYQANEIALRIEQRLSTYEQVLRGAKGLFAASKSVERAEFRDYVETQNLAVRYPGIQGVGFSPIVTPEGKARHIEAMRKQGFPEYRIWPEGKRELYAPVVYLEPFSGNNQRAFGYDIYSDSVRRTAMEKARNLDKTVMSGKLRLVQEIGADEHPGFLMYLPVFRNGSPHQTDTERRANIIGWVSAPFRMSDLMHGLLGNQENNLDLEIYDGEDPAPETLMYDSNSLQKPVAAPLYSAYRHVRIMEHDWVIRLHSLPEFEADLDTSQITIIRLSGISITLLLAVLVWQLAIGRTRALNLAQEMTRELRESSSRIEMLLHSVAEGIYGVDTEGNCTFINSAALSLLGYQDESELLGKNMHNMIHHTRPDGTHYPVSECRLYRSMRSRENVHVSDEVFWRKDGSSFQVDYWSRPTRLNDEDGAVITFIDITERNLADIQLKKSLALLSATLESTTDAILVVGLNGVWSLYNQHFIDMWHITDDIIAARNDAAALSHAQGLLEDAEGFVKKVQELYATPEVQSFDTLKFKDGRVVERFSMPEYIDGKVAGRVWSFRDVTARKKMEDQIRHLAYYDTLTKLPNRRLFIDRMELAMSSSKRTGRYCALLFLDLDNFKPLNDLHGHKAGDLLLIEVADRLKASVRETDTVARFGGDEFVVLLGVLDEDQADSTNQARLIAEKIQHVLSAPYLLKIAQDGKAETMVEHHCAASIGVTLFINHEVSYEEVLKRADMAMYQAKALGRDRTVVYNDSLVIDKRALSLRLCWHESYACGEPAIDDEHQKLFELANALIESATTRDVDRDKFDTALEKLLEHIVQHFAHEEAILARLAYPDLVSHTLAHKALIERALRLRDSAAAGGVTLGELVSFLAEDIVTQHMLKEDRKFYSLFV